MFRFSGGIDRYGFARAAALRIGLFVTSVAAFPLILMLIAILTSCRSVGGACGAVALVTAMVYKPFVFLFLVFSFVGVCLRRTRDAGVPAWVGLAIPMLLLADYQFLVFTFAPWSLGFSFGVVGVAVPQFVMFALFCIAALCSLPSRVNNAN